MLDNIEEINKQIEWLKEDLDKRNRRVYQKQEKLFNYFDLGIGGMNYFQGINWENENDEAYIRFIEIGRMQKLLILRELNKLRIYELLDRKRKINIIKKRLEQMLNIIDMLEYTSIFFVPANNELRKTILPNIEDELTSDGINIYRSQFINLLNEYQLLYDSKYIDENYSLIEIGFALIKKTDSLVLKK